MYRVFKRTQLREHFYSRVDVCAKVAALRRTEGDRIHTRYEVESHCGLDEDELIYNITRVHAVKTYNVYSDVLRFLRANDRPPSNVEYFVEVVCK